MNHNQYGEMIRDYAKGFIKIYHPYPVDEEVIESLCREIVSENHDVADYVASLLDRRHVDYDWISLAESIKTDIIEMIPEI